jgi:hypothetical protein
VYIRTCTVPMTKRKSHTLELLAFDEYCRFDTSACASAIKRGSLYRTCASRSIKTAIFIEKLRVPTSEREGKLSNPRGRTARDAWRKFTEIYGNPRGCPARATYSDFLPVIGTVLNLVAGLLRGARSATALLYHWEIKLIYQ